MCVCVCTYTYLHSTSLPGAHVPFTGQVTDGVVMACDSGQGHVRAFGMTLIFAMAIASCRLVLRRGC